MATSLPPTSSPFAEADLNLAARNQTDASVLRQDLCDSRLEAESLRLDLGDATAMLEALEAELWSVTTRWQGVAHDRHEPGSSPLSHLLQARTLLRRMLFQEVGSNGIQSAASADLQLAEVSFSFLLNLRTVRACRRPSP